MPVAIAFIVGAFVILWAERRQRARPAPVRIARGRRHDAGRDALKVGIAQAFALIPGTSRSGATIIGGMLFGLSRKAATEFSFFLAIPTLVAAGAYVAVEEPRAARRSPTCRRSASASSRRSSRRSLCVRWLIRYVSRHDFVPFAWYRIAFGVVILVTAWTGLVRVGLADGGSVSPAGARWIGPACAVVGVLGFSFKAILIKLAYAAHPVDAVTLLTLRMLYAAPFFVAMAWWAARRPGARRSRARTGGLLVWLGFIGYYLSSLLDFMGLQYITAVARAAGAVPLPDDRRAAVGAVSAARRITRRAVAGARAVLRRHRARVRARPRGRRATAGDVWPAARSSSAARSSTRSTWSAPAR